ncbi:MAG TPA: MerR family transcriptional regulator [Candidatus Anoxymicrobiaceae bacterium]
MAVEEKKYGIGEVQDLLKKEFPDITISKIRFLEKEGLLNPERTPSGYRKYSKANIKQLSYILRLQREEYLPLSVIKRKMQDLKSGKVVAGDMTVMSGQAAEPSLTGAVPVSLDLAPSKLGLSPETLKELVDYGIVNVHEGPEGKYFPPSELKVLNLAKEFFRYGVEPRHLRMFNQFVGREASFIEQIIRPQLQHKDPNTKRSAIKDLENLMALSQMFIQALLREALSSYLPRPASLDILEEDEEGVTEDAEMEEAAPEPGEPQPEGVEPVVTAQESPSATPPQSASDDDQMFPE